MKMRRLKQGLWLAMVLGLAGALPAVTAAGASDAPSQTCATDRSLLKIVTDAGRRLDKKLFIDPRLDLCVAPGQPMDGQRITYGELQALLALYGLMTTVEAEGVISIVREDIARQLPLRLIDDNARGVGEFEMVMKLIDTAPLNPAILVPILRPLLPQYAHLVAHSETNTMIMVGRYGNVRSLEAMLVKLRQRPLVAAADGTAMQAAPAK
jgi:general secretion pathway protein D